MPGRQFSSNGYRYGFNGQEKDDEVNGSTGTSYTAEFWQYDTRLGRRWNLEPEGQKYSGWSPYSAFLDSPILHNDPTGADPAPGGEDCLTCPKNATKKQEGASTSNPQDNTRIPLNIPKISPTPKAPSIPKISPNNDTPEMQAIKTENSQTLANGGSGLGIGEKIVGAAKKDIALINKLPLTITLPLLPLGGIEGLAVKGIAGFVETNAYAEYGFVALQKFSDAKGISGLYIFDDASRGFLPYVGKSNISIESRLLVHQSDFRIGGQVYFKPLLGTPTQLEVAETIMINNLGGLKGTANVKLPVSMKRNDILQLGINNYVK